MKLLLILLGLLLTITTIVSAGHHKEQRYHRDQAQQQYNDTVVADYHHGGVVGEYEELSYHPYQCGPKDHCNVGEICHRVGAFCRCLPIPQCADDIYLSSKVVNVWQDGSRGGCTYSQYDITIENRSNRNIKEIFIGSDYTLRLRDNSASASLWNMIRLPKGLLVLPSYQNSINAHASYTFGFIIEGVRPANLRILSVLFE